MFEIPQPSMALNSHNVPPPDYRMWNTRKVDKDIKPYDLLNNVETVANSATGGYLRCLVLNSHGSPGHLGMGTGIGRGQTYLFSALQGKVRTIVIVACEVAQIGDESSCSTTKLNDWQDGNLFCCEVAKSSQAYVFASTALQNPGLYYVLGLPLNCVDEYEGNVYRWAPDGSCRQVDNGYITRWMYNLKIGRNPQEWK